MRMPTSPTYGLVFVGSSPNNDVDYIGMSLLVYTNSLLQLDQVHDSDPAESLRAHMRLRHYEVYIDKHATLSSSSKVYM